MTTAVRETVEVKAPATVLRRVDCDERDAAILCAVLRGARTFKAVMAASDIASTYTVHYRLHMKQERGLIRRGLIALDFGGGTLRPGPRLAGIDHGWPLELVEVEV